MSREYEEMIHEENKALLKKLTDDRDLWRARAMAMFWLLPEDVTIGQLRDDTEKAKTFFAGT